MAINHLLKECFQVFLLLWSALVINILLSISHFKDYVHEPRPNAQRFFFRWLVTKSIGNEKQTRVIFRLELMFCFSCYLDIETKHKRFSEWNDDDDIEIEQILHHQGDSSVITHQSFFFSRLYIFKLNIIVFFFGGWKHQMTQL